MLLTDGAGRQGKGGVSTSNEERIKEGMEGVMRKGRRLSAIWEGGRWGLGKGNIDWAGTRTNAWYPSSRMRSGDKSRHWQLPEITCSKRRQGYGDAQSSPVLLGGGVQV